MVAISFPRKGKGGRKEDDGGRKMKKRKRKEIYLRLPSFPPPPTYVCRFGA